MFRFVRSLVSRDKVRYQDGTHDLDLTYITDRVVGITPPIKPNFAAMSFPATGVESTWRNYIRDVAHFLNERHGNNYRVYNLSERNYEKECFTGQIIDWCGFPDHHPPTVSLLLKIMIDMIDFLNKDEKNIVVVHCLAGKGRTGVIIACFLLYSGLFSTADDALDYYARMRSQTRLGVKYPSQIRSVHYLEHILKQLPLNQNSFHLSKIIFSGFGNDFSRMGSNLALKLSIYDVSSGTRNLLFETSKAEFGKSDTEAFGIIFDADVEIKGDIYITLYINEEFILFSCFNTQFLNGNDMKLYRHDIDRVFKDSRFNEKFFMRMLWKTSELSKTKEENSNIIEEALQKKGKDGYVCFINETADALAASARRLCSTGTGCFEYSGWLSKEGHHVRNWKRRWFVLQDNVIKYYKSQTSQRPQRALPVDTVFSVSRCEAHPGGPKGYFFRMSVIFGDDASQYIMCADSEEVADKWVNVILLSKKMVKQHEHVEFILENSPAGMLRKTQMNTTPKMDSPRPSFESSEKSSRFSSSTQSFDKKESESQKKE